MLNSEPQFKANESKSSERTTEKITHIEWSPENTMQRRGIQIAGALRDAGVKTLLAGGFVRDLVMDRMPDVYPGFKFDPNDMDFVAGGSLQQIKKILDKKKIKNTIVGKVKQYVTVHARFNGKPTSYDISSLTTDSSEDESADIKELFNKNVEAGDRDFTMNAITLDPLTGEIHDPKNGIQDIRDRVLRFTRDPEECIAPDSTRIFRYVRFRNMFKMKYDRAARDAIIKHKHLIQEQLKPNRIREDMEKILIMPRAAFAIGDLARLGILETFLPEISGPITSSKKISALKNTLRTFTTVSQEEFIDQIKNKLKLDGSLSKQDALSEFYSQLGAGFAWANLFHDVGRIVEDDPEKKADASLGLFQDIAQKRAVEFTNKEKRQVVYLIENRAKAQCIGTKSDQELSNEDKEELFHSKYAESLLFMAHLDRLADKKSPASLEEKNDQFDRAWKELQLKQEQFKQQRFVQLTEKYENRVRHNDAGHAIAEAMAWLVVSKRITYEAVSETLDAMKELLKQEGLYDSANSPEAKEKARSLLEKTYNINYNALSNGPLPDKAHA